LSDRFKIFISSRVNDAVADARGARRPLKAIRQQISDRLKAFDGKSIEVLVNEAEPAETDLNAVERCEKWAKESQLVLAIVNGHAGAMTPRGIGVCHLELKTAMEDCPQKVLLIRVNVDETEWHFAHHQDFKAYFEGLWSAWRKFGATARTADEVIEKGVQAIGQAVARMAAVSVREWRRRVGAEGEALEWVSKTYSERSALLVSTVLGALEQYEGSGTRAITLRRAGGETPTLIEIQIEKARLCATLTGVPDSFGIPEARKYCGYPFREDGIHLAEARGSRAIGPVHLVAAYKRVTEGQIRAHIGNPDISIIRTPFGYFCQDRSQAIQVGYLVEIDDSSRARQRANDLLEWLVGDPVFAGIRDLAVRRSVMSRPGPVGERSARPDKRRAHE